MKRNLTPAASSDTSPSTNSLPVYSLSGKMPQPRNRGSKASLLLTVTLLGTTLTAPVFADEPPTKLAVSSVVSATEQGNLSPLLKSVQSGDFDAVQAALAAGADANTRDAEGKTPLMWAAGLGRTDLVDALLKQGADVNAVDNFGRSALHYVLAAGEGTLGTPPKKKKSGFGKIFGKVKELGGGVLGSGMAGMLGGGLKGGLPGLGALGQSLLGQNLPSLLGGNAFNIGDKNGWKAIMGSAMLGDQSSNGAFGLQNLLSGDLKKMDSASWTNLLQATGKNNPKALSALGSLGPNIDATQSAEWKSFIAAAAKGDQGEVQKLMENGKLQSLLQQATQGLQSAVSELPGNDKGVGVVQSLLSKGANLNLTDKEGLTALKSAQTRKLNEVVALLQTSVDQSSTSPSSNK